MKQTINLSQFRDAFHNMGRGNQFSYEGLERIYEFFEELDPETELDVIAICCEFAEMSLNEVIDAYNIELDFERNIYMQVMDYLEKETTVLGDTTDGNIVFIQF